MQILILLVISFFLRLISLNQSLWLDEATTALVANMSLDRFFNNFMVNDFHPPLHYLVVKYWTLLTNNSEIMLRTPSVFFGVLTVYFTYLVALKMKFKNPLAPALLLATSGLHIYYSQEARMYAMATFLVVSIVLSYLNRKWLVMSLLISLLFLTDYLAVISVVALFLFVLIKERQNILKFIASLSLPLLTFVLWSKTFVTQLLNGFAVKEDAANWWSVLGTLSFKNVALIPVKFIIGRISLDNDIYYLILSLLLVSFCFYFIFKSKSLVLKYWFYGSLVMGIFISMFIPTLTYFRYLFVLPAFYLLISEKITKKSFYLLLLVNIVTSSIYLFNPKFHRENWRDFSKTIASEKLILPGDSQREALIYYKVNENVISLDQLRNENYKDIYLSRYVADIFDSKDQIRSEIETSGYKMVSELNYNGIIVWKYTK